MCPADSPAKEKSQVYLRASWCARSINCSKGRLDRQNRKFAPILVITEAKSAFFFKCTRSGFVYQELRDCRKDSDSSLESLTATRVESSHSVENVTRSSRVTIFLNVTWVESESPKIVTRVESLTLVTLSLPGTIVHEHVLMICGELEEFVHISWATKWIYKIPVLLVSVRQQRTPRALN